MPHYAKALLGAVIAALAALGTALTDDAVTNGEWVAVALAFFVALGGVYAVPNGARRYRNESGFLSLSPPELTEYERLFTERQQAAEAVARAATEAIKPSSELAQRIEQTNHQIEAIGRQIQGIPRQSRRPRA